MEPQLFEPQRFLIIECLILNGDGRETIESSLSSEWKLIKCVDCGSHLKSVIDRQFCNYTVSAVF